MLFNSAIFLVFFICVYILYWFVFKKHRLWILLFSGCVFYGWWDVRFLALLAFTSGVDFFSAQKIAMLTNDRARRRWLIVSVVINLATLGFFKYFNFFSDTFAQLLGSFGIQASFVTLAVVLPVGISFYTFQSIAYVTDVYRRKINPETSALTYFSFICFFPQMVAGPIERAKWLLPQFKKEKIFKSVYLESGLNLMLYGFFKKIVIADNLALLVDKIHADPVNFNSATLIFGVFAFAVQIYTDFSGYSDIARGTAQLLGFKLSKNFYFPYFSSSLKQFWQRWHISLSSWFRDYVYIPLGGSHVKSSRRNLNYLLTFAVSGLWHGANFTFIFWGFFHGLGLILEKTLRRVRLPGVVATLMVFVFTALLFTLFRSPSLAHFVNYLGLIISPSGASVVEISLAEGGVYFCLPLLLFFLLEISKYKKQGLSVYRYNLPANIAVLLSILLFSVFENAPQFIYFQF